MRAPQDAICKTHIQSKATNYNQQRKQISFSSNIYKLLVNKQVKIDYKLLYLQIKTKNKRKWEEQQKAEAKKEKAKTNQAKSTKTKQSRVVKKNKKAKK